MRLVLTWVAKQCSERFDTHRKWLLMFSINRRISVTDSLAQRVIFLFFSFLLWHLFPAFCGPRSGQHPHWIQTSRYTASPFPCKPSHHSTPAHPVAWNPVRPPLKPSESPSDVEASPGQGGVVGGHEGAGSLASSPGKRLLSRSQVNPEHETKWGLSAPKRFSENEDRRKNLTSNIFSVFVFQLLFRTWLFQALSTVFACIIPEKSWDRKSVV